MLELKQRFWYLQVEAKNKGLGCFYLSESLDEYSDYIFRDPEDYNSVVIHDSFIRSEPAFVNNSRCFFAFPLFVGLKF